MLRFKDSFGTTRTIEFSFSFDKKYINLTMGNEKSRYVDTLQIPREALGELIEQVSKLGGDNDKLPKM